MAEATTEDWGTEYLAPIMSVAVVDGATEALSSFCLTLLWQRHGASSNRD